MRLPVLLERVEQLARARGERLALAPVGAELVEVLGRHAAVLAGVLLVQANAVEGAQLGAEDHVVGGARRVQQDRVSRRSIERSMLMIGVIPLPALMNSSFSGSSSGSTKSPSTPPSDTIAPTRPCRTRYGETTPSSTFLTVIEMHPSARPGAEVSE